MGGKALALVAVRVAPGRYLGIRNHPLAGNVDAIKICALVRTYEVSSGLYHDFNLSIRHGDAAARGALADTETGANVPDVGRSHPQIQFSGLVAPDIKKGVATQQFNPAGFRIGDSNTAVSIEADSDIGRCKNGKPLPRYGLVQARGYRFGNEPR